MALVNTGNQNGKVILGYYVDDNSLTATKMPNIPVISPQAIVPTSATITYNDHTIVTPTGGVDGDIWYNQPEDKLFKKASGVWSLLTDRVNNVYYVPPVQNLTACPL